MLKPTSKDGIVIEAKGETRAPRALLADFDVDGYKLKKAHREWLDGLALFLKRKRIPAKQGKWILTFTGRADKSGPNKHNIWLSKQRADAALAYLLPKLGGLAIEVTHVGLGEEFPFDVKIDDNARDRSVEVFAGPSFYHRPPPPPPPPRDDPEPKPRTGQRSFDFVVEKIKITMWQVRWPAVPWGYPIAGRASCQMNVRITDPETDSSANYYFDGSGNIGNGDGDAHSVAQGSTQEFFADATFTEGSFEGAARMYFGKGKAISFRFGNTDPLHDFKGVFEKFRVPAMSDPLDGRGTLHGEFKRGVLHIEND